MTTRGRTLRGAARCWLGLMSLLVAAGATAGPAEDTEQAHKEFSRGNLVVAIDLWKKAANAGHAPAQVWLGDIYDKSEDDELAVEWYRKAAAQGDPGGEYGLGQMYAKGEGVKKDEEKARAHISSAAEKNHLEAAIYMREMYKKGLSGVTIDAALSEKWDVRVKEILAKDYPSLVTAPAAPAATTGKKKRRQ